MKNLLQLKKYIPGPNAYKIPSVVSCVEKRIPCKLLYKNNRKTFFTELEHKVLYEKIKAKPTSYESDPLPFRCGSAKIKGNLKISD